MDKNVSEYINYFKECKDIFICFKTEIQRNCVVGDRFYVYAHGGILCKLPKENCSRSTILLFDKKYIKYLNDNTLEESLTNEYEDALEGNTSDRLSFIKRNIEVIMRMMKNRANGKEENKNDFSHEHKERQRETQIAKINCNMKEGYVVCDMEYCVSLRETNNAKEDTNRPKADLVAVSIDLFNNVNIAYIEYKCTYAGLQGVSLAKHYQDMKKYAFYSSDENNEKIVRLSQETVICRYNKMVDYGLISGRRINFDKDRINSKIVFLITHIDEIKCILLGQYTELLKTLELKKGEVVFVQNDDENIVLSDNSFQTKLDIY